MKHKRSISKAKQKRTRPPARRQRAANSPSPGGDALDTFIAAAAFALDLPVEPAWQGAIKNNLAITLRLAASVADFPLPDDAEPAPVFTA